MKRSVLFFEQVKKARKIKKAQTPIFRGFVPFFTLARNML